MTSINQRKQETKLIAWRQEWKKFDTILLIEIWNDLLEIMNKTSINLHNNTVIMNVATKCYASLVDYVYNFHQYESATKENI